MVNETNKPNPSQKKKISNQNKNKKKTKKQKQNKIGTDKTQKCEMAMKMSGRLFPHSLLSRHVEKCDFDFTRPPLEIHSTKLLIQRGFGF